MRDRRSFNLNDAFPSTKLPAVEERSLRGEPSTGDTAASTPPPPPPLPLRLTADVTCGSVAVVVGAADESRSCTCAARRWIR